MSGWLTQTRAGLPAIQAERIHYCLKYLVVVEAGQAPRTVFGTMELLMGRPDDRHSRLHPQNTLWSGRSALPNRE